MSVRWSSKFGGRNGQVNCGLLDRTESVAVHLALAKFEEARGFRLAPKFRLQRRELS